MGTATLKLKVARGVGIGVGVVGITRGVGIEIFRGVGIGVVRELTELPRAVCVVHEALVSWFRVASTCSFSTWTLQVYG